MKVSVKGYNDIAVLLRQMLEKGRIVVTDEAPDYTVSLINGTEDTIVIDGINSDFERRAINFIAELTKAPIVLQRADGVRSEHELAVTVGDIGADREAVLTGLYRAIASEMTAPTGAPSMAPTAGGDVAVQTFQAVVHVDMNRFDVLSQKIQDLTLTLKDVVGKYDKDYERGLSAIQDRLAAEYTGRMNEVQEYIVELKKSQSQDALKSTAEIAVLKVMLEARPKKWYARIIQLLRADL